MKKILSLTLLLLIILSIGTIANAEEAKELDIFDALKIDEKTKETLSAGAGETVIRVFNIPVVFAFNDYNSIEELLGGDQILETLYAIIDKGEIKSICSIDDGKATIHENSWLLSDRQIISALLSGEVLNYLPKDAAVFNIFYLWGQPNYQGTALYFETDKGGFVYYKYYLNDTRQYLFPANEFFDFMKEVYSTSMGPDTPPGGGIEIESVWDLSKYIIAPQKEVSAEIHDIIDQKDPPAETKSGMNLLYIVLPLLAVAVFAVVFAVIRKRSRAS